MADPTPPPVEPDSDDGVRAVLVGLGLWAVAGVACLLGRDTLAQRDAQWWAWTCVIGFGLGLVGLGYVRRRAAVYREHRQRSADGTVAG